MKLTAFLLLISLLQVSASTFGQKVTLKGNEMTVNNIFKEIRKQTGYSVMLDKANFKTDRKVSANFNNASIQSVMEQVLEGTGFSFVIEDKNIIIEQKEKSLIDRVIDRVQAIDITGKVLDSDGRPLPGASVTIKGTKISTTTQSDGSFNLKGVNDDAILVISYMGFEAKEIKAGRNLGLIRLIASTNPLDEVQVMAYGTTSRRLSTSNIGTVKADVIEKQAGISNPLLALQGRVPGLVITQITGVPGGAVMVRIQGQNSIGNGNAPLFVVDGVPLPSFLKSVAGSGLLGSSEPESEGVAVNGNQGSPLSYLNPTDIESIDVLKDADATAIYGSQAANGAILITTKKGKPGKMQMSIDFNSGWGKAIESDFQMLNTRQYLDMRYEAFRNDGIDWRNTSVDAPDLKLWDTTRYTNWRKELMGKTALTQRIQASIMGGSSNVQYRLSGTYNKTGSIFPDNGNGNPIASVSANLSSTSANQRLTLDWSTNYQYNHQEMPGSEVFVQAAWLLPPHAPSPFNQDGTINWAPDANNTSTYLLNPYIYMKQLAKNTTTNLISNLRIGYSLFKGLKLSSSLGYTNMNTESFLPQPSSSIQPEFRSFTQNSAQYGMRNMRSWIAEPQVSYQTSNNFGKIDVLLGGTFRENESWGKNLLGSNYATDALLDNIASANLITVNSSEYSQYKYLAYFGRLTYNLADQLILNLSARRDGSSRFGLNNRFNNFWSFAGAWIWSQQKLINENLPWLSFGKLSASYGITGSDAIGDYRYIRAYSTYSVQVPYYGVSALQSLGLPNPDLVWERVNKFSTGLNLGFIKDRILLNINYSQNHSDHQLLNYAVSNVTGASFMVRNLEDVVMRNSTWEFSLNTINIKKNKFEWSTNFNFSIARNKLVSWKNLETSSYRDIFIIGEPIDLVRVTRFGGVNPATGEYVRLDKNGHPTTGAIQNEDMLIRSRATPFYGGVQNTLQLGSLSLDFFIQFTKKWGTNYSVYNGVTSVTPGVFDVRYGGNQPINTSDRWRQSGDDAKMAKISTFPTANASIINASDVVFREASFARLKNASLTWQIPSSLMARIGLHSARITASGQNLLTLTGYNGPDPETSGLVAVPPLRVYSLGIQAIF